MNRTLLPFFALLIGLFFFGCKSETKSQESPAMPDLPEDSVTTDSTADTDFSTYLNDTALVFTTGAMHGEEVPKNAEKLNWLALVMEEDSSFSIKKIQLKKQAVYDPIIDGEDETLKTGIYFSYDTTINVLYFISIPLPEQNQMNGNYISSSNYFFPGKSYSLIQNEKSYKITATGDGLNDKGEPTNNSEEMRGYKNYRILFEGPGIQQELLFKKEDYENTPQPLFFGDLNKDGIPDLIMDVESHYNITGLALFLSENGKLRLVAYHSTSGC